MTDFTVCTAAELIDLYQKGSASPVTVAQQVLAKIDQLNPVLNAFCYLDPDTHTATGPGQCSALEKWSATEQIRRSAGCC
jgi:Asp-tRNA(Asn)/Glu-tRNA(Gln) amidotransferase A subunit family amidase